MQQEVKDLLQALYEEYQSVLRVVAYKSGIPWEEVDDIVQDAFVSYIRVYGEKIAGWNEAQRKSVIMRILKNRCTDYHRGKKRHKNVSMDTGNFGEEYQIPDQLIASDVSESVAVREDLRIVRKCIQEMKPDWRDVIILHFVEGRPVEEVGEIMHVNVPTLRMRISRIRKYLREQIGAEEPKRSRKAPKDG